MPSDVNAPCQMDWSWVSVVCEWPENAIAFGKAERARVARPSSWPQAQEP